MNKLYNFRNSEGRFTRRVTRNKDGKFTSNIITGRLYDFRGATVRALKKDPKTGTRMVSFHKTLFGFVKDRDLNKINSRQVKNYLAQAK